MRYLMVAAVAALALVAPQLASARPPVLLEVGRIGNQPNARWALPEGVEAFQICFETFPADRNRCWSNNIYEGGTRFAPQTERLRKGTYNVYVLGHDSGCSGCPQYEQSNTLKLVIPAQKPIFQSLDKFELRRAPRRGFASLAVCDFDSAEEDSVGVVITQMKLRNGKILARRQTTTVWKFWYRESGGCGLVPINWRIPLELGRRGDTYRVTFTVISVTNLRSRTLRRQLLW